MSSFVFFGVFRFVFSFHTRQQETAIGVFFFFFQGLIQGRGMARRWRTGMGRAYVGSTSTRPGNLRKLRPAMPKKVWKTSTRSPGRSAKPPVSQSCKDPNTKEVSGRVFCRSGVSETVDRKRCFFFFFSFFYLAIQDPFCEFGLIDPLHSIDDPEGRKDPPRITDLQEVSEIG